MPHAAEDPDDPDEHGQVDGGDHVQERAGDARPHESGHPVQHRAAIASPGRRARADRARGRGRARTRSWNDRARRRNRRPRGRLPFAEELARRVVDRRDMVGVERVAQAQRIRGDPEADTESRSPRRFRRWRDAIAIASMPKPSTCSAEHRRREAAGAPPFGGRQAGAPTGARGGPPCSSACRSGRLAARSGPVELGDPRAALDDDTARSRAPRRPRACSPGPRGPSNTAVNAALFPAAALEHLLVLAATSAVGADLDLDPVHRGVGMDDQRADVLAEIEHHELGVRTAPSCPRPRGRAGARVVVVPRGGFGGGGGGVCGGGGGGGGGVGGGGVRGGSVGSVMSSRGCRSRRAAARGTGTSLGSGSTRASDPR